jgi:hypothetical protein
MTHDITDAATRSAGLPPGLQDKLMAFAYSNHKLFGASPYVGLTPAGRRLAPLTTTLAVVVGPAQLRAATAG